MVSEGWPAFCRVDVIQGSQMLWQKPEGFATEEKEAQAAGTNDRLRVCLPCLPEVAHSKFKPIAS